MAGRIRQSDVEEVKARTNIADIVGEHVSLKSAGVGSLKGLCPFHDERSPSFHVRPGLGYYHCFGCGESGDVYSFLQRMDHVSFTEAVERLASRIGFELHYEDGAQASDHGNRARLLAANQAAAEFFVERLGSPEAEVGRRFLGERGFDAEAARRFGVGFAPKSWDAVTNHLKGRGFTTEELAASGLVSQGDRGVYDRFRGRLIWPIRDVTGQTVGFGARRLLDDDQGPKYLNTPETAIYHKAQVLYGLDLAKRDIAKTHRVVVVEGYTDVMACHLAGVTTAIATSGTSFGVEHIKVLRRVLGDDSGLGEVVFTFDGDAAGQQAAMRAFAEEQRFAAQTFVAVAPDGLDPCDLRLARGDAAVRSLVEARTPLFEFVIRHTLARYDLETVEGRVGALRAAAPVVAEIRDPALRPGYTRELARMLGLELGEVTRAVRSSTADRRRRGSGARSRWPARRVRWEQRASPRMPRHDRSRSRTCRTTRPPASSATPCRRCSRTLTPQEPSCSAMPSTAASAMRRSRSSATASHRCSPHPIRSCASTGSSRRCPRRSPVSCGSSPSPRFRNAARTSSPCTSGASWAPSSTVSCCGRSRSSSVGCSARIAATPRRMPRCSGRSWSSRPSGAPCAATERHPPSNARSQRASAASKVADR